ncbi:hypothetical protein [Streptomyces sp. NPDC059828]|uniref:hypothetical protein n=1 Tax=Streptomyces sp. NPDC059828 TaxID=3346965 RepID=UPI0036484114
MNIRIRRWHFEWHQRALYITRLPDPKCPDCDGHGAVTEETAFGPEYDYCHCWDPTPVVRIPLWFRRTESVPF